MIVSKQKSYYSFIFLFNIILCSGISSSKAQEVTFHQSLEHNFQVKAIVKGLEHPWSLAFLPNGNILVSERTGRLRLIKDGRLDPKPISGLPENIFVSGQGGLLDIALHPDFKSNNLVYFSYAGHNSKGAGTEVGRGQLKDGQLKNFEVIFRVTPKTPGSGHYGSRLVFDQDHTLFITVGDRQSYSENAQDIGDHLGTVIRLNDDGSVPKDNPFIGQAEAQPEIYSYGHRNPQGMALHPQTHTIWLHEHGPRGGDEINIIKPGANYGWPKVTYGIDYSGAIISNKTEAPGIEKPITYWDPSIAPSGMAFYSGHQFPKWQGNLFVGALAHRHLRRLELKGEKIVGQEILLKNMQHRIRDVRMGLDGYLYVLTDSNNGQLLQLKPVN